MANTKPKPRRGTVSSANELAAALDCSASTVSRMRKRGMPVEPDGSYHVETIRQWRADHGDRALRERRDPAAKDDKGGPAEVLEAKRKAEARLATRKAQIADLDYKARAGDLFEVGEHVRIVTELLVMLRRRLEALAHSVPGRLNKATTAKQRQRWLFEFDALLNDLAAKEQQERPAGDEETLSY